MRRANFSPVCKASTASSRRQRWHTLQPDSNRAAPDSASFERGVAQPSARPIFPPNAPAPPEVGHVIGIVLVQVHRAPHMRQRFYGVIVGRSVNPVLNSRNASVSIITHLTTAVRSDEKPGAWRLQENRIFRRLGSSRAARSRIAPTSIVNHQEVMSHPARQRAEQRGTRLRVGFPSSTS